MKTKEELVKLAEHYFKNPEVNKMFATRDGNFFHANGHNYATGHAERLPEGMRDIYTITRADLGQEVSMSDRSKGDLQEFAREQGHPESEWKNLKKDDLLDYLEDMASAGDTPDAEEETDETEDDKSEDIADELSPDDISDEDAAAYLAYRGKPAVHQGRVTNKFKEWKKNQ